MMCDRTQSVHSGHSIRDMGDTVINTVGEGLYCGHFFIDTNFKTPLTTAVTKPPRDKNDTQSKFRKKKKLFNTSKSRQSVMVQESYPLLVT